MQHIQELISRALKSLYNIDFTPDISPAPKPELGEYCVNIFPIVKQVGKAPNIISEEVAAELAKQSEIFRSTSATGGYVNFFLADTIWLQLFREIVNKEQLKSGTGPTIVVDYIGANVGKPLHIGHICTPSIGQTICNVYHHLGYRVIGDSHFGDWGGIFGKLIWQWKKTNYIILLNPIDGSLSRLNCEWNDWKLKEACLEDCGIKYLVDLYQNYHESESQENDIGSREEFKKLSEGEIENVKLWKKFTSISITETEKKLELLNVHATYNIGESFYEGLGLPRPNGEDYPLLQENMKDIVAELIKKGIATQNDDGSVGVVFPDEMKLPSCILQKKDGTGLYLTSDLAAIKYRLTNGWNPEKIIYSVDVRQQLHLRQAFTIAKMAWGEELGANQVEFTHAHNGFIKLKEGAMSTRHGTVIFLQELIDEGNERTEKILQEKGRVGDKSLKPEDIQAITVGAIKYSYLAQDREKDVTFDWDKALNFEGNSGPYIQYACVRARKITDSVIANESEAIQETKMNSSLGLDRHASLVMTETMALSSHDKSLIQILLKFDEVVATVAKTYKPHHLAQYAYDLAVSFNGFYVHTPKIVEEKDEDLKILRLSLVAKSSDTLEKAFDLLGIKMPSEM